MHVLPSLLLTILPTALAQAQEVDFSPVIARWIRAFEGKKLRLYGSVLTNGPSAELYGNSLVGVIDKRGGDGWNHLQALKRLTAFAHKQPSQDATRALLMVAGTGIDTDFYRPECYQLRAIGQAALCDKPQLSTLHFVQRTACGEVEAWAPQILRTEYRAAALHVLGLSKRAVFRPVIEAQLLDIESGVRLAAAEALASLNHGESLAVVRRALALEPQPLVRGALVRTLGTLLAHDIEPGLARKARQSLIAEFGQGDPRLDALLLKTFEQHRDRRMIAVLIDALSRCEQGSESPLLRERVWRLLSAMTGESFPWEHAAWQAWWRAQSPEFEVKHDALPEVQLIGTRENFFGIPVYGREVIFVLDTSGSMDEAFGHPKEPRNRQVIKPDAESRLQRAKRELAATAQRLQLGSRYQMITFATDVRTWSRGSIAPGPKSNKALLSCLDRMKAEGGTELYGGVLQALGASRMQYGHAEQDWVRTTDEIFVLSDGEPSGAVRDPELILKLIGEANRYRRVRINTIFIGGKEDSGVALMRALARQHDGVCRVVGG